jgi:hypothetical protein
MNQPQVQLPQQDKIRQLLRLAGPTILVMGFVLTGIGLGSFFSSFGSFELPRYFWCAFLGLPLLFLGSVTTYMGFMGAIQRYLLGESIPVMRDLARESAPVIAEVANTVAEGAQPAAKTLAKAIAEGVREGLEKESKP